MTLHEKLYKFMNEMDFVSQDRAHNFMRIVIILVGLVLLGSIFRFHIQLDFIFKSSAIACIVYLVHQYFQYQLSFRVVCHGGSNPHVDLLKLILNRKQTEKISDSFIETYKLYTIFFYISIDFLAWKRVKCIFPCQYPNQYHLINMIATASKRLMTLSTQFLFSQATTQSNIDFVEGANLSKIVLNKPKALNSLNLQMIRDLAGLVSRIQKSPAFWVEGAGGKAFCAGGDVKALYQGDATIQDRQRFFREQFTLDFKLATSKSIQIANWDGIVMGGGVGISHLAPFRIATESTMFAMPQAKIGFYTDVGSAYTLANLRNNIGMYIALTSGRLKGQQVYNSGFANYYVNKDSVQKIYEEISKLIKGPENAKAAIQSVVKKYHVGDPNKKIANEDEISHIFSAPTVRDIYERARSSTTAFGKQVVKSLEGVCPISIHVTHRLILESKKMEIRQIFKRDFLVAQHFIQNSNFQNGVTSLLITKDNKPQWTHKHLLDVTEAEVSAFFKQVQGRAPLDI